VAAPPNHAHHRYHPGGLVIYISGDKGTYQLLILSQVF